jgi:cellulose synthase/poly-beta-1,6-N-acetylglucosamine synthase-like glycosyltransferase
VTAIVALLLWFCALCAIIPLTVILIELSAGLMPLKQVFQDAAEQPQTVILMPAHNEASIISDTVQKVQNGLPPQCRLLVVADNCSDETARLARDAGAAVVERSSAILRGKGYAIAFGGDSLVSDPPDYIVILDADCLAASKSIEYLVRAAQRSGRPVQARYCFTAPSSASPVVQISNFAFYVKNVVRQRGMSRMGDVCLLTGAGMALSWNQFRAAAVASGAIVEDLAMGLDLMKAGHRPLFLESALITSDSATAKDTVGQRQRWEHGYLSTMSSEALPCIAQGLVTMDRALLWTGLHLLVPPLALLVMISSTIALLQAVAMMLGHSATPFLIIVAQLILLMLLLAVVWLRGGKAYVQASALARLPLYMLWKVPIYLRLLTNRQREWNRTPRGGKDDS